MMQLPGTRTGAWKARLQRFGAVRAGAMRVGIAAALVASAGVLGSCGGGDPVEPAPQPVVASVTVSAPTSTLAPAQLVQLTAVARTSAGAVASTEIIWRSSAAGVATVNNAGLVTAVAAGVTTISATTPSGVQGTVGLTVIPAGGTVASVTVTLSDVAVAIGDLALASASARDAGNNVVALGSRPLTWSSTNTGVVTISTAGVITTVGVGTSQIRATVVEGSNTLVGTANITVLPNPDAKLTADVSMPGLTFSPTDIVLKVGGTVRFIFPNLDHNVFWSPRITGAPADISTTANRTVSLTFPTVGVFPYVCTLHNGMVGTVVVSP